MVDAFMKIGDVNGEAQDTDHLDQFDVLAWSWGIMAPASVMGGGLASSRPIIQDFSFTKRCDIGTSDLVIKMLNGAHHSKATFELRKSGGEKKNMVYFKIEFTDVFVTSVSMGGSDGDTSGNFVENVSFAFKEYELTYTKQNSDGSEGLQASHNYNVAGQLEG